MSEPTSESSPISLPASGSTSVASQSEPITLYSPGVLITGAIVFLALVVVVVIATRRRMTKLNISFLGLFGMGTEAKSAATELEDISVGYDAELHDKTGRGVVAKNLTVGHNLTIRTEGDFHHPKS